MHVSDYRQFSDFNISQPSVATLVRCVMTFNDSCIANLKSSPTVNKLKIHQHLAKLRAKYSGPFFWTWCSIWHISGIHYYYADRIYCGVSVMHLHYTSTAAVRGSDYTTSRSLQQQTALLSSDEWRCGLNLQLKIKATYTYFTKFIQAQFNQRPPLCPDPIF